MKYISKTRQVQCDKRVLEYTLTIKEVKNINLRIKADGKIYVSANKQVPIYYIDN
ncbi:MAG TPA: M48 family metallopeptidase, partial [Clostridiales bacterium]|nr:M48 family metallopeptidase [Clostridiales bacterium]